jgi:glycosyltransferase involved in cell wall biosynthesis
VVAVVFRLLLKYSSRIGVSSLCSLSKILVRDDLFMRVVFISHSAGLCGAERSLLDLVVGVQAHGVQPTVVLPRYGPLADELERNYINYIVHPYHNWVGRNYKIVKGLCRFIINRASVPGLVKKLRGKGFDLVYTNTLATPVGATVAKAIGVKHVWHARELVEGMDLDFDYGSARSTRFISENSAQIIYNSCVVEEKFKPLFGGVPGAVIYNGWLVGEPVSGISRKSLAPEKPIKLCIVGSIHRGKGQHHAIEALSILKKSFPYIELDIVGVGNRPYMRELKNLCSALDVSTSVAWCGFASNVAEIFRRSDITLVCSQNEGFGRVVVEAMAEGCPVVASRSGGIPEIIEHGVNGLMYQSGSVEDLVQQIALLITDPDLYLRISREGVADVYKRFSRQRYAEEVHHVLKSL